VKVLVTGGAGFIGSHIVEALRDASIDVRVLDCSVADPRGDVDVIVGDLRDHDAVARAVDGVDAVCHQAAKVGLGVDFGDAPDYVDHNDAGTITLLRALWERHFRGRLVLASSMVVYGPGLVRCDQHGVAAPADRTPSDLRAGRFEPGCRVCGATTTWVAVTEEAPLSPPNVYAATKLHQEHLCAAWAAESGASAIALRYHNVYGPRMPRDTPYAGVAAIFRSAVGAGRAPRVFEDGGQTRDFVHVRDVARANVLALTREQVSAGAYNIASGTPHTVNDLAVALTGDARPPVVTGEWRVGDIRHVVAVPGKAEADLGFQAEIGFADGMAEFAREVALATSPG
jgi:dTDP-L-rhamnose 4-epimerase